MTTEAAVKSRDSERQPTANPAMVSGVQPAEKMLWDLRRDSNNLNAFIL